MSEFISEPVPEIPRKGIRAKIATWLVRHIAHCYDEAIYHNAMGDKHVEEYWAKLGNWRAKYFLPLAKKIHKDAAVDQMVRECYWG